MWTIASLCSSSLCSCWERVRLVETYIPSLSLPSAAAAPFGKIVFTKMPMRPRAESCPPTMLNPRPCRGRWRGWTWEAWTGLTPYYHLFPTDSASDQVSKVKFETPAQKLWLWNYSPTPESAFSIPKGTCKCIATCGLCWIQHAILQDTQTWQTNGLQATLYDPSLPYLLGSLPSLQSALCEILILAQPAIIFFPSHKLVCSLLCPVVNRTLWAITPINATKAAILCRHSW